MCSSPCRYKSMIALMLHSHIVIVFFCFFFFQAEDGIRDYKVTGVQTCALPICHRAASWSSPASGPIAPSSSAARRSRAATCSGEYGFESRACSTRRRCRREIGRAAGRGRGEISGGAGSLKKKKKETKG